MVPIGNIESRKEREILKTKKVELTEEELIDTMEFDHYVDKTNIMHFDVSPLYILDKKEPVFYLTVTDTITGKTSKLPMQQTSFHVPNTNTYLDILITVIRPKGVITIPIKNIPLNESPVIKTTKEVIKTTTDKGPKMFIEEKHDITPVVKEPEVKPHPDVDAIPDYNRILEQLTIRDINSGIMGLKALEEHIKSLLANPTDPNDIEATYEYQYDLAVSLAAYYDHTGDEVKHAQFIKMKLAIQDKVEDYAVLDTKMLACWVPDVDRDDFKYITSGEVAYAEDGELGDFNIPELLLAKELQDFLKACRDVRIPWKDAIHIYYYENKLERKYDGKKLELTDDLELIDRDTRRDSLYIILIYINTVLYIKYRNHLDDMNDDLFRATDFYNGR